MGPHRNDARSGVNVPGPIAQVVPDIATFAVDDGFSYRIPDGMIVSVGSVVRVPLGVRRVRGFVVGTRLGDTAALKEIIAVSGDYPVFDEQLLRTLRWAALHYVAPQATLLGRAAPANLPRGKAPMIAGDIVGQESPLPPVSAAAASGGYARPTYLIAGREQVAAVAGLVSDAVTAGRNVAVVAPTLVESEQIATGLQLNFGTRVVQVASATPARDATRTWVRVRSATGSVLVGTPEIALWPVRDLAMWVVVGEGRRAMKAKQTPTLHVRELVRRRSAVERTPLVFLGQVPTLEVVSRGVAVVSPSGRSWPFVDIVDRGEDGTGGRVLATRTVQSIHSTVAGGGQVFVFVSRRGYAPAFRCVKCRQLRRCSECGAGPGRADRCRRCGAKLGVCSACGSNRFEPLGAGLGRVIEEASGRLGDIVGPVGSGRQVIVGTERDLPYVPPAALAVVADADSLLLAPHYRAEEDALRLIARVAISVVRGRGRRCLVQSSQPAHRVLAALRHGKATELLQTLAEEREDDGLPPAVELIAIEVTGPLATPNAEMRDVVGAAGEVHGPESGGGRTRWLVQGASLGEVRIRLRAAVQRWRDEGLKVRIDADPVDL